MTEIDRKSYIKEIKLGRVGGQVVSMLDFNTDDPSSNPADVQSFSVQFFIRDIGRERKRDIEIQRLREREMEGAELTGDLICLRAAC